MTETQELQKIMSAFEGRGRKLSLSHNGFEWEASVHQLAAGTRAGQLVEGETKLDTARAAWALFTLRA